MLIWTTVRRFFTRIMKPFRLGGYDTEAISEAAHLGNKVHNHPMQCGIFQVKLLDTQSIRVGDLKDIELLRR